MLTVAIGDEFLEALGRLPQAQQKKVREFTKKFRANPTAAAINYEKIHAVKDPRIRTVRIDQKYRAVVLHPDEGNVYMLVWVDNHDEAMDWARTRTFEVNPVTGALQVFNVCEIQELLPTATALNQAGLLTGCTDEVLLSFGVPAVLLPAVRAVTTTTALQDLTKHLPAEAAEALLWLAEGFTPEEVREAVTVPAQKEPVDTQDFAKALAHPDSRRRFVTLQSDEELAAMLDAPLAKRVEILSNVGELDMSRLDLRQAQRTFESGARAGHIAGQIGGIGPGKMRFGPIVSPLASGTNLAGARKTLAVKNRGTSRAPRRVRIHHDVPFANGTWNSG